MGIKKVILSIKERISPQPLEQWYIVKVDDEGVYFDVSPSNKESWKDSFNWESVERICFKDEGLYSSDAYYVFTSNRPESYVIPEEANGGKEFVHKMLELKLFDDEYFIQAMGATDGGYYCWPKHEEE